MSDREKAISILSEIRSGYSCFDSERPYYHALSEGIKALNEQQRTGRWEWDVYDVLGADSYKCSSCGYHAYGNTSEIMLGDFKFCPNCGAEMEVEHEQDD